MTKRNATRVVINACYGGFSLSDEATREWLRRNGKTWTEENRRLWTSFIVDGGYWSPRDIERTDPTLIALVQEMGAEANGSHADLKIEELPKGTHYRIHEYDGYESIETRDGIDWSVA